MAERFALKGNLSSSILSSYVVSGRLVCCFPTKKALFFFLFNSRCQVLRSHCSEKLRTQSPFLQCDLGLVICYGLLISDSDFK